MVEGLLADRRNGAVSGQDALREVARGDGYRGEARILDWGWVVCGVVGSRLGWSLAAASPSSRVVGQWWGCPALAFVIMKIA